jgi:hypothetical protein
MFDLVMSELELRGQALMAGRLESISRGFTFPLASYLETRQVIVASPNDMQAVLARMREELVRRNILRVSPEISALEVPRGGRFRAWVRWHEISADRQQDRVSDVIYYSRLTETGFRTEMMHYTRLSMPELRDTFASLAMTA